MTFFTRRLTRKDGTELEVDGTYRIEDNVVEILETGAWLWTDRNNILAPILELTSAEVEQLEAEITADPSTWSTEDYYD